MSFVSHTESAVDILVEAMQQMIIPTPSIKLPGWPQFNAATGGFRTREFSILCGSTGLGKTTMLANWSRALIEEGTPHFVMSVETGHTDYIRRVMSVFAEKDLNTGRAVSQDEIQDWANRYAYQFTREKMYLGLYDNRVPVETLCAELRFHCEERGCKVAFIDNLNFFMEVTSAANAVVEMDRVIHELIILAKQIDMHIVMVMHPKKTETNRIESVYDIKGSSTAVQEAHNVFFLNRSRDEDNKFGRELMIAKMRRRGEHVGNSLCMENIGTSYIEKGWI